MIEELSEMFKNFFNGLEDWQKDLLNKMIDKNLSDGELETCFDRYIIKGCMLNANLPNLDFNRRDSPLRKLIKLSNLRGIGAIENEEGLTFGDGLSLVFGSNGSGKSTYVNLMKNISNSRGSKQVKCDVFKPPVSPCATVVYLSDKERQFDWSPKEVCDDLRGLQFFDAESYKIYGSGAEILLEPKLLIVISNMAKAYGDFRKYLNLKISKLNENILIPDDYISSTLFEAYNKADSIKALQEINENISWDVDEESELKRISISLSESDPLSKINKLDSAVNVLRALHSNLKSKSEIYSDEKRDELIRLKKKYKNILETVRGVDEEFSDTKLDGAGNDVWKILWESAKNYSEKYAYPDVLFPNLGDGSLCVLCQQPISETAKKRFISFKEHVNSNLEIELSSSRNDFKNAAPTPIEERDYMLTELTRSHVPNDVLSCAYVFYSRFVRRHDEMTDIDNCSVGTHIFSSEQIDFYFNKILSSMESDLKRLKQSVSDRRKLIVDKMEMSSKKWFSENKAVFNYKMEILWLGNFNTDTTSLSRSKTKFSEVLITREFVKEFRAELKNMGSIVKKVELKSFTKQGISGHKIILKEPYEKKDIPFSEILSEGERKAVSFAAFVSELKINHPNIPLVFDDPTSSLDDRYETKIADKLIELSKNRQVIVLTHRLSMAAAIHNPDRGQKIHCIKLMSEGVGVVDDTLSIIMGKTKNNVSNMLDKARAIGKKPVEDRRPLKNDLILKVRKLLERLIEEVLFDGVVRRFQREVHSKKLYRLTVNEKTDIEFIDELMSKYSFDAHDQPDEAPGSDIELDELIFDLEKISEWINNVEGRRNEHEKSRKHAVSLM